MGEASLALRYLLIIYLEFEVIPFVTLSNIDVPHDHSTIQVFPGHLEPLGSRNTKQSLETISDFLTPVKFFEKYVAPSKPVLIRGGAKLSPAFNAWSDDYFLSFNESRDFKIVAEQRKKEIRTYPAVDISFEEFVKTYERRDIYLVNGVPPFLQKDVLLPPPLLCEEIVEDMLVDTVMWFSSGGTKSVLHNDDVDNINCLFSGTKELLFIDYKKYKGKVPIDFPSGGYSGVDVDSVDFVKYPSLKDVEYYNVSMEPGDCLFIPYKWFHQVRSYDRNIAVNVWWRHKTDFIPQDCDMEPNQTLDKFNFSSLQEEGNNQGTPDFLAHLESLVAERSVSFVDFEQLLKEDPVIIGDHPVVWNEQLSSVTRKIFETLDVDKSGEVSAADMQHLGEDSRIESVIENELARIEDLLEDQLESEQSNSIEDATSKDEL
ncbi:tRNA wybutosine-synthesizing protein 5-like [Montipora capricornis]|uniref:tRNA wybutosine-synthesizing protein 5-like n=1 Tax=Montipora capricornis TaxID=246305 RepID=UPI0035F172E1